MKLIELLSDTSCLTEGAAQICLRLLQLDVRVSHHLALSAQCFDCCPGLSIFACELLHRLAVLLQLFLRLGHERGRFLGLLHDVRHFGDLRSHQLEAGNSLIELRNPRNDRRQLLGCINRPVLDVLDSRRNLGQLAAAPIELLEQGTERIPLVASGEHDLIQLIGILLCFGAEGKLLEH